MAHPIEIWDQSCYPNFTITPLSKAFIIKCHWMIWIDLRVHDHTS